MTEHLDIQHWGNGFIFVQTENRKWDGIFLYVNEQRELLNYLLLNIEKHENEYAEDEKRRLEELAKSQRKLKRWEKKNRNKE